ncbi:MAG TPA: prolyl oligopeptidase family serine peptidase, partial [Gammaproteobacteria bacterium]|nr:prolyl oligopeptidase family serine peptidase [Gammaproteobacteria bacterium]
MGLRSLITVFSFSFVVLCLATPAPAFADNSATPEGLSLEVIMQNPEWLGRQPEDAWWSWNGEAVYYTRKREGEPISDTWKTSLNDKPQKVTGSALANLSSPVGEFDARHQHKVFVRDGNIFIRNLTSGDLRQLTRTTQTESNPLFMASGNQVAWQVNNTWYIHKLETGLTRQAADVRTKQSPAQEAQQDAAQFDYLQAQQMRLFSTLREKKADDIAQREAAQAQQQADPTRAPLPFYLGDDVTIARTSLSPNGRYLLVVTEPADYDEGKNDEMPVYVTSSGYIEHEEVRTLVGENPPAPQHVVLLDLKTHQSHELDLKALPGITDDPLAELREKALEWHVEHGAPRDKVKQALQAPDVRAVRIEGIEWTDDGDRVALQIHSVDNKDRWIAGVDFESNELKTLHRLHDPAWINWYFNAYGWLPNSHTLWYLSESTGYSHLYLKPEGEDAYALTDGKWEVSSPVPNADGSALYFIANKQHPGWHDIYKVSTKSGDMTRLTTIGVDPAFRVDTYMAPFYVSPDETKLLFRHSDITHPPELYVQANQSDAVAQRLTHTISDEYLAYEWPTPEIIKIPSDDIDRPIYAKLYLPEDYDPNKTYPAVMFVHGAGYLHNVHSGWALYFREFMFNTLLTKHDYIVLEMDYRGSAGYGRDWRTAIYRQMGHPELEDYLTGKQWLVENYNVDPQRVGIYGGSYGGFMTFMALFRAPDAFAAGAALRPVTDWAHYNHPYTSNILNTPLVDPMAYEKSSPIEWAENYENVPLLIAHGMQDDNVFYKDTVRLVERLLELEKENYYPMYYPL